MHACDLDFSEANRLRAKYGENVDVVSVKSVKYGEKCLIQQPRVHNLNNSTNFMVFYKEDSNAQG